MTQLAVLPLLEVVREHAADPDLLHLLDHDPDERTWIRLLATEDYELWLISWPPGAATDWHDHGSSSGAFTVLDGQLTEHTFDGGLQLIDLGVGDARRSGPATRTTSAMPPTGRRSPCTRTRRGSPR